jgi:rhodanese-related sulfurtransferase
MEHLSDYLHNHPYLVGIAVLMAIAVLVYELRARAQDYSAVVPQEAIRLMNGGAVVFDVRDAAAFAAGHINGAKPLTDVQVGSAGESLKKYKQKNLIVYCERGVSASAVVRKLHAQGFTQVFNLKGGLTAWRAESLPLQRG